MASDSYEIFREVPGLYRVIPLTPFRRTAGVSFDFVPMAAIPGISAIDRVVHQGGAVSPGPVGGVAQPWYMHPCQDDNLLVLHGVRHVDLYSEKHGRMESFRVYPDRLEDGDGKMICATPCMLVWPTRVFHRIVSGENGSASLNFAVHHEGFDIRTNFNIYDLDQEACRYELLREGYRDQK